MNWKTSLFLGVFVFVSVMLLNLLLPDLALLPEALASGALGGLGVVIGQKLFG